MMWSPASHARWQTRPAGEPFPPTVALERPRTGRETKVASMHLALSDEQNALRDELRSYFAALMTSDLGRSLGGEHAGGTNFRAIVRRLGTDGWLGTGWK